MTSIGGYSDTLLDYMRAREASHRRDMHARSPSPVVRKGVDSTELDCVGAHLVLSTKDQSYPTSIGDLTDDEVASLKPGPTPKPLKTVVQPQPRPDGNSPSGESSTARTYTPKASGQYLPPSEMEEFWRQRSISFAYRTGQSSELSPTSRYPATEATTVESDTYGEETHRGAYIALSESHTPSHRSMGTVDEDNCDEKDGPAPPGSCSKYIGAYGKNVARKEKTERSRCGNDS